MEKDRRIKLLSVIALLIAVVGLTVAFAAMSKTLTINGTASMDTAKWDIRFQKMPDDISELLGEIVSVEEGTAKIIKKPTISEDGTYWEDFEVTLSKPGDSVRFWGIVKNAGDIDARLSDILINNKFSYLDFLNSSMSEEESLDFLESIYVEADWDGDGITTLEERLKTVPYINPLFIKYNGSFFIDGNSLLKASETANVDVEIIFSKDATELPKGNVTIKLNFQLLFEQA